MKTKKTRHGLSATGIYSVWIAMKKRCENQHNLDYPYYGGRGIKICERWKEFTSFLDDMGPRPEGMTLDRIDPEGDYTPENCRWATRKEQSINKRNNVILTFNGIKKTLPEWAEDIGINIKTLRSRIFESKWPIEKALTTPTILKEAI